MSTATLKTEIQSRINALVYSSGTLQAKEVLKNAIDTVGLDLDLTNIIAVHNSMTSAVVAGTSTNDITALNTASIALGITSKSVVSPIKSIQRGVTQVNVTDVVIAAVDMAKTQINLLTTVGMKGSSTGETFSKAIPIYIELYNSTTLKILGTSDYTDEDFIFVSWEVIEYV